MKIKTEELRKFKANSSFIKQNGILPILSYIKFEGGAVTKNNQRYFLSQDIEHEKDFLIDEKILFAFIESTDKEEIDITIKGKFVYLSDGSMKVESPTDSVSLFPKADDFQPKNKFILNKEVLTAIGVVSNFILPDDLRAFASNVFVGGGKIAGSNGHIGVVKDIEETVPKFCLKRDAASAISAFEKVEYYESDSYTYFNTGSSLYGFVKQDAKWLDIGSTILAAKGAPPAKPLSVDKTDIVFFNKFCSASSVSKFTVAKLWSEKNTLLMELIDSGLEIDIKRKISCQGSLDGFFGYVPGTFNELLTAIPDQLIRIYRDEHKLFVSGDSGYKCILLESVIM